MKMRTQNRRVRRERDKNGFEVEIERRTKIVSHIKFKHEFNSRCLSFFLSLSLVLSLSNTIPVESQWKEMNENSEKRDGGRECWWRREEQDVISSHESLRKRTRCPLNVLYVPFVAKNVCYFGYSSSLFGITKFLCLTRLLLQVKGVDLKKKRSKKKVIQNSHWLEGWP